MAFVRQHLSIFIVSDVNEGKGRNLTEWIYIGSEEKKVEYLSIWQTVTDTSAVSAFLWIELAAKRRCNMLSPNKNHIS